MLHKQFIYWWQKWLRLIAVRVVVTICLTAGVLGIWVSNTPVSYATAPDATVYRSPECSCCGGWIKHLKAQGFQVRDFPTSDIEVVKQKYNVPDNLTSCHTAVVNGYVIEGHVPADDIKRLLQDSPNVAGLSVPQMPVGTPGMEMGNRKDPFTVFSFKRGGLAVFNEYSS
ncbi:DUF411 domain-containing protein [Iningainema tapete]|uniref:DUF411 domain-containing protein n=1 Tax=Iningainema tapete BLCC-T55 TaxID=2748662 RepID=A0A8J7C7X6_9CYAN|nr:DUF411 domain-containing protein [Iningainema tapete]MBD2773866.1 DUF411 domain-containing protein [Iningainema tapete BLCC-T55]